MAKTTKKILQELEKDDLIADMLNEMNPHYGRFLIKSLAKNLKRRVSLADLDALLGMAFSFMGNLDDIATLLRAAQEAGCETGEDFNNWVRTEPEFMTFIPILG